MVMNCYRFRWQNSRCRLDIVSMFLSNSFQIRDLTWRRVDGRNSDKDGGGVSGDKLKFQEEYDGDGNVGTAGIAFELWLWWSVGPGSLSLNLLVAKIKSTQSTLRLWAATVTSPKTELLAKYGG